MLHRLLLLSSTALLLTTACKGKGGDTGTQRVRDLDGTWVDVAAGDTFTCLISDQGGTLQCYGPADSPVVTDVPTDGEWMRVAAGAGYACARKADGYPVCWGVDDVGQATADDGAVVSISAGYDHACALQADGYVNCWGNTDQGATVVPNDRFEQISAGQGFTCGIGVGAGLQCWGDRDGAADPDSPAVPPALGASAVAAGYGMACGVSGGNVTCWGDTSGWPGLFSGGDWDQLSLGAGEACGLKTDGSAHCAGLAETGELLEGSFEKVTAGGGHGCAIRESGRVVCWMLDIDWIDAIGPS